MFVLSCKTDARATFQNNVGAFLLFSLSTVTRIEQADLISKIDIAQNQFQAFCY